MLANKEFDDIYSKIEEIECDDSVTYEDFKFLIDFISKHVNTIKEFEIKTHGANTNMIERFYDVFEITSDEWDNMCETEKINLIIELKTEASMACVVMDVIRRT